MKRKLTLPVDSLFRKQSVAIRKTCLQEVVHRQHNFEDLFMVMKHRANQQLPRTAPTEENDVQGKVIEQKCVRRNRFKEQQCGKLEVVQHGSLEKVRTNDDSLNRRSKSALNLIKTSEKVNRIDKNLTKITNRVKSSNSESSLSKQYHDIVSRLDHKQHQHLREVECFLSQSQVISLLKDMYFISEEENIELANALWKDLEGDVYGGIPSENLLIFLLYVVGQFPEGPVKGRQNTQYNHECGKYVTIDKNLRIVVSPRYQRNISLNYLALKNHRIQHLHPSAQRTRINTSLQKDKDKHDVALMDHNKQGRNEQTKPSKRKQWNRYSKQNYPKCSKEHEPRRQKQMGMLKEKVITNNSTGTPLTTSPNSTASSFPVTPKNVKPASKIPSPFEQSLQSQPARVSTTSVPIDPITRITIRKPILSVDVNLGEGVNEKLIVYQGENANEVSRRLVEKYNIDETLRSKFEMMLHTHIRSLLWKIDEVAEEMITDREE